MERYVKFLLVEDNEDHAELFKSTFSGKRFHNELAWVKDGEQALAYVRREGPYATCQRPHVVLLDLRLPKISGHEVLEAIKSDPKLMTIAVVVLTSSEADRDCVAALEMHANGYLVKPVDFSRLHEIVDRLQLFWSICNYPAA